MEPCKNMDLFENWNDLLVEFPKLYEKIMWEAWMPSIRQAGLQWNVKDGRIMLNIIEKWNSILTPRIMENIKEQIVLPKIIKAVEDWDPWKDEINSWFKPWISHLGSKLKILFPTIRHKIAKALAKWEEAIDPSDQGVKHFRWVLQMMEILPVGNLIKILEAHFFPKWLKFLGDWLNESGDFDEVQRWYLLWREQFPANLIKEEKIVGNFQKALEIIEMGIQYRCRGERMDFSIIVNKNYMDQPNNRELKSEINSESMENTVDLDLLLNLRSPQRFRDLVQLKCEKLGVLFCPLKNKYFDGMQVYQCGNLFIYICNNVIYVEGGGNWKPMSLKQLIFIATLK
ncbi:unnamed protein product [Orchesella dallaii]|uniref:GCF C-terminal domain-containing protein n=1 Tax=Orchesella dallaii TaxID=48710 RepID=A0ABP1S8S3_9HEXA